jgi:hypothetical protein
MAMALGSQAPASSQAPKEGTELLDRYITWLDSAITNQQCYHERKETMAWSATLAYATGVLLISYYAAELNPPLDKPLRFIFCVLLFGIYHAAFIFVAMQFECRWEAADRLVAFRRTRTKLSRFTSDRSFERSLLPAQRPLELPPNPKNDDWQEYSLYPKFVQDEINYCKRPRENVALRRLVWEIPNILIHRNPRAVGLWSFFYTKFIDFACIVRIPWVGKRRRSEIGSYIILFIATISAVGVLWLPEIKPLGVSFRRSAYGGPYQFGVLINLYSLHRI